MPPQRWGWDPQRLLLIAGLFSVIFAAIPMGVKHFCCVCYGSRLDFDTICMGFKSLVSGRVGICMGFKRYHLKSHANSIDRIPPSYKTRANSSKSVLVHC